MISYAFLLHEIQKFVEVPASEDEFAKTFEAMDRA
jgi:hypothetical protein